MFLKVLKNSAIIPSRPGGFVGGNSLTIFCIFSWLDFFTPIIYLDHWFFLEFIQIFKYIGMILNILFSYKQYLICYILFYISSFIHLNFPFFKLYLAIVYFYWFSFKKQRLICQFYFFCLPSHI